jgi:hypothetical protein
VNFILLNSGGQNVSPAAGSNQFFAIGAANATEANIEQIVATSATYTTIRCFTTANVTGTLTMRKNAVSSTVTCAFTASSTCTGTSGSMSVIAGDRIDVFASAGTLNNQPVSCAIGP